MRHLKIFVIAVSFIQAGDDLRAERRYVVGTEVSFVTGGSNRAPVGGGNTLLQTAFSYFNGVYPSITFTSAGSKSSFLMNYNCGLYRSNTDLDIDSASHGMNAGFTFRPTKNLRLGFSDSFDISPDFTTSYALRGILFVDRSFRYLFDPIAERRLSYTNNASGSIEYQLNRKSSISFDFSHSYRDYERNPYFRDILVDQQRITGSASFRRNLKKHRSLSLQYSVSTLHFSSFEDALTHGVRFGYSYHLSPTLSLTFGGGPTYTVGLNTDRGYYNYSAEATLSKSVWEKNRLFASYSHQGGDTSGIGSTADIDQASVGFAKPLGRKVSTSVQVSLFNGRQRLDNPGSIRGYTSSGIISVAIDRRWSLSLGGTYARHEHTLLLNAQERRAFASLGFHLPELWKFTR